MRRPCGPRLERDRPPPAVRALLARRRQVVEWAYAQTTPCDFEAVDERGVVVIDRAVEAGFTDGKVVEYVVTYIDSNGDSRTPARSSAPRAHASPSPPARRLRERSVRGRAPPGRGRRQAAPRWLELRLMRDSRGTRLLGLRH
ncbi:MAG: hypothetical protein R3F14_19235 [Polyangiaceae bacterium]